MSAPTPFIRPYNPSTDEPAIFQICQETLPTSLKSTPAWHIGPYVWAVTYVRLTPGFCFVLDAGNGTAVGYIVGTPSLERYLEHYEDVFLASLQSDPDFAKPAMSPRASWNEDLRTCLLQILYDPAGAGDLSHADVPGLLESFPAHLHIDLLPEFQRKGWGRQLMARFLGRLTEEEVKGVHLVMVEANVGAESFYRRLGFKRWEVAVAGGGSREMDIRGDGNIWLTRRV